MKRKLWIRLACVGAVTLFFIWQLIPPQSLWSKGWSAWLDVLRPGIDLAGGTRMIYQVTAASGESSANPAEDMVPVLKDRLNHDGTKDMIIRADGTDRIEIVIPKGTLSSKERAAAFDEIKKKLLALDVMSSDIDNAKKTPAGPEREKAFGALERGVSGRAEALKALVAAWTKLETAINSPAASRPDDSPDSPIAKAREEYEKAVSDVRGTNLRYTDVAKVLGMSKKERAVQPKDAQGNPGSSPEEALLKQYPERAKLIGELIAANDEWKAEKQAVDDPNDIKRQLRGTGVLEFHIAVASPGEAPDVVGKMDRATGFIPSLEIPGGEFLWVQADPATVAKTGVVHGIHNGIPYLLVYNTPEKSMKHTGDDATDWKFESATVGQDQWGGPAVHFGFDERGGLAFGKLTGANIEKPLCTVLDNKVITLANIRSMITTNGEISGSFSLEEVRDMVQKMKSGALRGKLSDSPVSETSVDAQLGATQRSAGLKAALIALIAVVAFMLIYYFVPLGLVADIAVLFNLLYLLGAMAMIHASFTLPGIAGLILTIGIAVDANVLIDERIREEQAKGYNLRTAIKNGYNRAFSVIIDAHITAILTTVILYFVGTTEIKGFAMTLGIGLVFSLFTAVFLTRWLLQLAVEYGWIKNHVRMLKVIGVPKIRWMDKRYIFWGVSLVTLTLGVGAFFYQSINNPQELYDVQFIGGTTAQVSLKAGTPVDEDKLARMLEDRSDLFKAVAVRKVELEGQPAAGVGATYDIVAPAAKEKADDFAKDLIDALSHPNKDRIGKDKDYGLGADSLLPAGRGPLGFAEEDGWKKVTQEVQSHSAALADEPLPTGVFKIDNAWMSQAGDVNLEPFKDGVGIVVSGLKPAKLEDLGSRINATLNTKYRKLPTNRLSDVSTDEAASGWELFGLPTPDMRTEGGVQLYTKVLYVARDNQYASAVKGEANPKWLTDFALPQVAAVHDAFSLPQSLSSLNSVGSSVAGDLVTRAWLAIILSMVVIMIYIGVRFGNWLFGLGAIIPILHDAGVVIGLVAISKFLAQTFFGQALLISDFRFDLTVVAAVLTVIGYSTNDTIVVFDRIRENRGRLSFVSGPLIDNSVNQTLSRTILTSLTVFLVIIIMYVLGGQGIRAFNYAMLVGVVTGTYSSIAIAAPVLLGWRRMVHRKLTAVLERADNPADAGQVPEKKL